MTERLLFSYLLITVILQLCYRRGKAEIKSRKTDKTGSAAMYFI